MNGTRIYPDKDGHLIFSGPGQYGLDKNGHWYASVPTPEFLVGNLADHEVIEHEDGTISVSPSILVEGNTGITWHGFLEHGVWREA